MLGSAGHWTVNTPPWDHGQCLSLWSGIASQHYRQGSSGYTFYNWGYCNHGQRLRGRGWDRQSGANGTTWANQNVWALVWIGGPGHAPNGAALATFVQLVMEAPNTPRHVSPHQRYYSTACPGPDLVNFIARTFPPVGSAGTPNPPLSGDDDDMTALEMIALLSDYVVGAPAAKRLDGKPVSLYDRLFLDLRAELQKLPAASGGGVSESQVRAIVRDELNKTKLAS